MGDSDLVRAAASHNESGDRAEDAMVIGVEGVANTASAVLLTGDRQIDAWLAAHRPGQQLSERDRTRLRGMLLSEFAEAALQQVDRAVTDRATAEAD
jgi:hypothetical protein